MSIDFDSLVLAPNMSVFGRDIVVSYNKSRPSAPPVQGKGIYKSDSTEVQLSDGSWYSEQNTSIDLRVSEWDYLPARGDRIWVEDIDVEYWVADQCFDGQGGVHLPVRRTQPEDE